MAPEKIEVQRYTDKIDYLETESRIPVKNFYKGDDLKDFDYDKDLNDPGQYPFTRGLYPEGYRKLLWLKSQIVCPENADDANDRIKKQIAAGQTGLRILADYPTNLGIDPDHPLAVDDIGCSGVSLWALVQMEKMLKDLPMENVDFEFAYPGPHATLAIFGQFIATAEKRNLDIKKLRGTTMNCVLSTHGPHLYHNYPIELGRKINTDFIEFCTEFMPTWHPIVPNSYHMTESGADTIQQLALLLGSAIAYSRDAVDRGVDFDKFASKMVFSMTGGIDFFETVCKIRVARRMWAKIAKEKFNAKKERSCEVRIALRTSGVSLTKQQPINNIVRLGYEALGGALGGANSIDLAGYDEAYVIPGFEAHLINLNIHQLLAHETGVGLTVDPLGGSYYVEHLTNTIEKESTALLNQIEDMGGAYQALKSGWVEALLKEGMLKRQEAVESGRKKLIGVNKNKVPEEQPDLGLPTKIYKHDFECNMESNLKDISQFKDQRNIDNTVKALKSLYDKTKVDENLHRPVIEALKSDATLGEVVGVIRMAAGYSYDHLNMLETPNHLRF